MAQSLISVLANCCLSKIDIWTKWDDALETLTAGTAAQTWHETWESPCIKIDSEGAFIVKTEKNENTIMQHDEIQGAISKFFRVS